MKNLTVLETADEVTRYVRALWRTPAFRGSEYVAGWVEKLSRHPAVFAEMSDSELEYPHFATWFGMTYLRTYTEPAVSDLYYLHEIVHATLLADHAAGPPAPGPLFTAWYRKMNGIEFSASLETECNVYLGVPGLRDVSFKDEIWADRYLGGRSRLGESLKDVMRQDRYRAMQHPDPMDYCEQQIAAYARQKLRVGEHLEARRRAGRLAARAGAPGLPGRRGAHDALPGRRDLGGRARPLAGAARGDPVPRPGAPLRPRLLEQQAVVPSEAHALAPRARARAAREGECRGASAGRLIASTARHPSTTDTFIDTRTCADQSIHLPIGIAISQAQAFAYVANDGARGVEAIDLNAQAVSQETGADFRAVPSTAAPTGAALSVQHGKEAFTTGLGRWSLNGAAWGSCAACHFDGLSGNVTWYFARGPRHSVSLDGTFNKSDATDQRVLNWTGIFDEVADFESNVRGISGGVGAIVTTANAACTVATETTACPTARRATRTR